MRNIHYLSILLLSGSPVWSPVRAETIPVTLPEGTTYHLVSPQPVNYYLYLAEELARRDPVFVVQQKPWRRVMEELAANQPMVAMPLLRLPEREAKFSWAGPIVRTDYVYLSLTAPVSSDQVASGQSIGVLRGSGLEAALRARHLPHIIPQEGRSLPLLLQAGKIDLWYSARHEAQWVWDQLALSPPLHIGAPVAQDDLWVVATPTVPPAVRDRLHTHLRAILADNAANGVNARFFIDPPPVSR